ncbi:MAG: TetR/AcrR family transcriptional regulator [Deltaproteobacteria bacterium]|nr:TetR/AcrR family transcriptional regulator [Deltaproteobacteria bacterium]
MTAKKKARKKDLASPTPKGRRATPEATRDALIESGMALFAERGLDGPSLDDICAHAGLTRGAFYVHFADRDAFLLAVMDRVGERIIEEMIAKGSGGFAAAVERFVAASASGRYPLMPEGGIRPYQLLDACARSPVLRERYVDLVRKSIARVAELIEEGQGAGMLRGDVTPTSAATLALALIVGAQTLADLGMPMPLETLAPDVVRLLGPAR